MEDLLKVGIITSTHGIKGEVKVYPTTDDPARFKKLKSALLKTGKESINVNVSSVKFFKQFVILKFKEFNDINEVEGYRKAELFVKRSDAVNLDEDEFYIADLIGIKAVSEDGIYSGEVVDVLSGNANDVYVVKLDDDREVLLPAIKECIKEVDPQNGILKFNMMDGLL
ncbi:MAG: ribosome maturation factor RimM [Lachnospiraceae bacterium]|nr:ribosome maturation factor RimM [Lachnospiraceae bacterium]